MAFLLQWLWTDRKLIQSLISFINLLAWLLSDDNSCLSVAWPWCSSRFHASADLDERAHAIGDRVAGSERLRWRLTRLLLLHTVLTKCTRRLNYVFRFRWHIYSWSQVFGVCKASFRAFNVCVQEERCGRKPGRRGGWLWSLALS
jgi:hypothetical protein